MAVKLYQYSYCQFCRSVRNKLDELNVKYRKIEVDRDNKPEIVQNNKEAVPLIVDDRRVIGGSVDIIKYLTRKYGRSRKT